MTLPTRMLFAAVALAVASGAAAQAAKKAAKSGGGAVFVPAAEAKFSPVPGFDGVQIAPLQGDPGKGASHFLLKYAAGFKAPVHHHSANHYFTVVSGTLVLEVDGKEHKLPPGSYVAFTGKKKHATRCEAGAECVLAMDVRGKWDVVPAK
jgi:quercetin dioxygenase-like cupin family protein